MKIQCSPIESIQKLCIDYTKKLMKPYQFERQYLKKISLLFNVIRPFKFKYGLVSFGRTQTLISTCDDMKRQFIWKELSSWRPYDRLCKTPLYINYDILLSKFKGITLIKIIINGSCLPFVGMRKIHNLF